MDSLSAAHVSFLPLVTEELGLLVRQDGLSSGVLTRTHPAAALLQHAHQIVHGDWARSSF